MSNGDAQLREIIARVGKLGTIAKEAAPDAADAVRKALKASAAAHTTPDGKPWQLTKEGDKPLDNAPSEIFVAAVGSTVFVKLKGKSARHHLGRARGRIVREVIPERGIPAPVGNAIGNVLDEHFQRIAKGG